MSRPERDSLFKFELTTVQASSVPSYRKAGPNTTTLNYVSKRDLAMEGPGWWSLSYFKHKHTLLDQNVVSDVFPLLS